jgi:hypothetical protein
LPAIFALRKIDHVVASLGSQTAERCRINSETSLQQISVPHDPEERITQQTFRQQHTKFKCASVANLRADAHRDIEKHRSAIKG